MENTDVLILLVFILTKYQNGMFFVYLLALCSIAFESWIFLSDGLFLLHIPIIMKLHFHYMCCQRTLYFHCRDWGVILFIWLKVINIQTHHFMKPVKCSSNFGNGHTQFRNLNNTSGIHCVSVLSSESSTYLQTCDIFWCYNRHNCTAQVSSLFF